MHYMLDTEDEDSAAERFWPEGYKQVIREDLRQLVGTRLNDRKDWHHIYQRRYLGKYSDFSQFIGKIADMVVIGAENGVDDAFDDIITAFLTETPLPEVRRYARYLWPQALPQRVQKRLRQVIVDEYSRDEIYNYAFNVGYQDRYRNFDEFIEQIARLAVTGATNGADDMLATIYGSCMSSSPLPPTRRHPRRLKSW